MNKKTFFKLPALGLFSSMLFLTLASIPQAFAGQAMSNTTTTWYVNYVTGDTDTAVQNWAYAKGVELGNVVKGIPGTQDNVVILDFGAPTFVNGKYGATVWKNGITVDVIKIIAQKYAQGYYDGTGSDTSSQLKLTLGTSNSGGGVSTAHAKAWAQMVKGVGAWLDSGTVWKQVNVRGGMDIEMGYNTPSTTKAWLNAYKGELVGTQHYLYNFGDAGGCPQSGTTSTPGYCNNGWTQDDVDYVSRGSGFSFAIPEIYSTGGGNAKSWQQLSLYSYLKYGSKIFLKGPLTQMGACGQKGCSGTDNTPSAGWNQLWDRLNADSRTAQSLTWSTDIRWRK